jgi:hypothetical protein
MDKFLPVISVVFTSLLNISAISGQSSDQNRMHLSVSQSDTISDIQLLYNGRLWRGLYHDIVGDEFFPSKNWLNGEVFIDDLTFKNVSLRYDIYNDQLITSMNQDILIQLNKEHIKGFSLTFENKKYLFENFGNGNGYPFKGFGQVLYKGKTYLVMKEIKKIQLLAVENRYDEFYQLQDLFIFRNGTFYPVSGKKDLLNALSDRQEELQKFIKKEKIRIRKKSPDSFIPVIKFYDDLK